MPPSVAEQRKHAKKCIHAGSFRCNVTCLYEFDAIQSRCNRMTRIKIYIRRMNENSLDNIIQYIRAYAIGKICR